MRDVSDLKRWPLSARHRGCESLTPRLCLAVSMHAMNCIGESSEIIAEPVLRKHLTSPPTNVTKNRILLQYSHSIPHSSGPLHMQIQRHPDTTGLPMAYRPSWHLHGAVSHDPSICVGSGDNKQCSVSQSFCSPHHGNVRKILSHNDRKTSTIAA